MRFTPAYVALATTTIIAQAEARHPRHFKHEAVHVQRRQAEPPVQPVPTTSAVSAIATNTGVLTYVIPSPDATPIAITEQSQLVTSFVPQFTICDLPPQAAFPVTPIPQTTAITAPYRNYSISIPTGTGECETFYSPTQTMVCATTLTGLISKYTVSECDQDITFSTEYGYVMVKPTANATLSGPSAGTGSMITPAPTVQRLTTYLVAPWEAVTAGTTPDEVRLKVCAKYENGTTECIEQYEVWHTSLVTENATSRTSVNISTTVHGPNAQIIVATYAANITEEVSTIRMTTDMELEYKTQYEVTEREIVTPTTERTNYRTITVENATPSSSGTTTTTIRSTQYLTSTTTVYVGTSTARMPSENSPIPTATIVTQGGDLPTPTTSVDWADQLGIETALQQ